MRILAAVAAALLGLSVPALAGAGEPGTLSRCTRLLPEGRDYTFKVDGTLRNDGKKTTVKRTLVIEQTIELPEGAQVPPGSNADAEAFGREIEDFQKCLDKSL